MKECNYCGTAAHSGPCPSETIPNPFGKLPRNISAPESEAGAEKKQRMLNAL